MTPVILMRCLACAVEFCLWLPRGQWTTSAILTGFSATAAVPYRRCDTCGQDRVRQIGDIELAPLFGLR